MVRYALTTKVARKRVNRIVSGIVWKYYYYRANDGRSGPLHYKLSCNGHTIIIIFLICFLFLHRGRWQTVAHIVRRTIQLPKRRQRAHTISMLLIEEVFEFGDDLDDVGCRGAGDDELEFVPVGVTYHLYFTFVIARHRIDVRFHRVDRC